jgi:protein subunit release factor B
MGKFGVTPQKEAELLRRMAACGLHEEDLREQFIRGSGPGGQKVNRTASCVQLRHLPSGLEVKMREARSQGLNRFYARRRLCELLEAEQLGEDSPEARKQDKIRKQKARRRRRSPSAGRTEEPPEA